MKKRVLSLLLTLVMLLGLLPTAALAGLQAEAAAKAAAEEGTLLSDILSPLGEEPLKLPELPVIQTGEDEERSFTLSVPQPEEGLMAENVQAFSAAARAASPFQMALPNANQSYYYYGGDISGTIGVSGASRGWSGTGRGNFNASVSGSGNSYTLTVTEKEKYKKSNIIYQPFTLTMDVPAYSTRVLDLDIAMEGWRNSKGAASYYLELFFWGTEGDKSAATKFNVGENRTPTPGAATLTTGYRYFSDSKNGGESTGQFSLSFTNASASAKTVTYYLGAYVGVNCSTSLLSSYHHTLDARFTFTATGSTTTEYAAAVNGKLYTSVPEAISAYNAASDAYLQLLVDEYYTDSSITLKKGGTVDLGGKELWLKNGATLDVRGGGGTVTHIANGTIVSTMGIAITHSGAGNLYLGTEDGAMTTSAQGANTGALNTGGHLIILEGVKLLGSKGNAVKNTGAGNIYFQGTPTLRSGGGADIDLGRGIIGLRKALTNARMPYTVYLPDYSASVDPPRRVTDVWSSKMGSADPKDYFTIRVPNVSPKPAALLQPLTNGGNAVVVRPLILTLRPNGGSGVPSYVTVAQGQAVGALPTPTRKGYTFDGWFLNADRSQPVGSDTTFTADAVLTAGWSYTRYIVVIQKPDGTTVEQEIAPGETYGDALPEPPEAPVGKEFDHWEDPDGNKVTENTPVADTIDPATGNPKPLKPVYRPKTYTITFDYQVTGSRAVTRKVEYGKGYGTLPTMARTGYTLQGWYTHKTAGEQVTADTLIPAADQTLYARWTANSYTVSFDLNEGEGTAPADQTVNYQAKYTLPADPTRTNYTFTGWYTAAAGGTRVTADTKLTNAGDHTLYAQWSRKVYTATFQSEGKTVETRRVNAGDALGTLPAPARVGYTFAGWGGVTAETVPTGSVTYTAAWTPIQYPVNVNGESKTITVEQTYGDILPAADPSREGYTFNGWQNEKGDPITSTAKPAAGSVPAGISPKWTANQYTVTFAANGGSVTPASKRVTYAQPYGDLPVPVKEGSNFVGWQDASGKTVTAATEVNRAENHTLTAQWAEKHQHKVDPNGSETVEFTTELTQDMLPQGSEGKNLSAGSYVLTQDLTFTNHINITGGTVNICLNGHTLRGVGGYSHCFNVYGSGTLNLCDCAGTGQMVCEGYQAVWAKSGGTVNLYGGTFTVPTDRMCVQAAAGSTVTVDGATLTQGSSTWGTIRASGGTVELKSGKVAGERAIYLDSASSTVTISGGEVQFKANGVRYGAAGTLNITGGRIANAGKVNTAVVIDAPNGNINLSGSPELIGTNSFFFTDKSAGTAINVTGPLTGTYTVNASKSVIPTEGVSMTVTKPTGMDYSVHFVPVGSSDMSGVEVRNVGSGSSQTVELYKPHRHLPCGGSETCAHSGPGHNEAVEYQPLTTTGGIVNGGHYYLTEDITLTNYLRIMESVSLCLNGHTIVTPGDTDGGTGNKRVFVRGVLSLCDCKTGGKITQNTGYSIGPISVSENGILNLYSGIIENTYTTFGEAVDNSGSATINVYGGTLIASRPLEMNLGDKSGELLLSGSPVFKKTGSHDIIGWKPGFLVLDGGLQKPSAPYCVAVWNMNTRGPYAVLTTGWPTMGDADPKDYFTTPDAFELEKNEEGELVLRLHWAEKKGVGVVYLTSNGDFNGGDLDEPERRAGYLWDGWYTAETGGTKLEAGYNKGKIYEDITIYPRWTECDHSGHDGSVDNIGATCTTAQRRLFTCTKCGLEVDQTVGEPLGHDYKDKWEQDSDSHWRVCDRCGMVETDSQGKLVKTAHTFGEAAETGASCTQPGSRVRSCAVCGHTVTETYAALGHSFTAWVGDESGHWHVCAREGCGVAETGENGATIKADHTWGDWQLTTAPQVNVAGEETAFCADCGYAKTQPVAALPVPEYAVTYEKDEYTVGDVPSQGDTAQGGSFTLPAADCGLQRTGYTLSGWALLDEVGVPVTRTTGEGDDAVTAEALYTGSFTMPGRAVTFPVRWSRLPSYDLKPGETIVLEDGTVIKNESGGVVTIDKNGDGQADTTITLPEGEDSVTVKVGTEEDADKIILPPGSKVETDPGDGGKGAVITIGDGEGAVDPNGKVDAPAGSTVEDPNGNKTTITGGQGGTIDPDGGVTFPEGEEGEVTVTDPDGNGTQVTVPGGGEGLDVTPGGKPIVNAPDGTVTVTNPDGSTTITPPEGGDGKAPGAEIDDKGNIIVPGGSTVTVTDPEGNKTQVEIPEEGGAVTPGGQVGPRRPDRELFTVTPIDPEHAAGSIAVSGNADRMEWRKVTDPESAWETVVTDGSATALLDGLEEGAYEFRYKAEGDLDASLPREIRVPNNPAGGKALIIDPGITGGTVSAVRDRVRPGFEVRLTVKPNSGYRLDSIVVHYGDGEVLTPVWNTNTLTYNFIMPEADATVTAAFISSSEPVPRTFTVTFHTGEGSGVASQSVREGSKAARPAAPTREGYTFGGWFTDPSCSREWSFSDAVTRSMTLYAKWEKVIRTFIVSFDAQGGAPTPADQQVEGGKLALKPTSPEKEDRDFGGWYTEVDGGKPWQFSVYTVGEDTVLYARWTGKNEGSGEGPDGSITLPDGGSVTLPEGEGGSTTITAPDGGGTLKPTDDGGMEVPGGSTVKTEGGAELTVPDEGGKVTEDGTLTVPGGSTVTVTDGEGNKTQITLPEDGDGTVTPTDDGKVEVPVGSTVQTGEDGAEVTVPDGGGKVAEDGTVTVPGGSTVTVTDDEGNKTQITLPEDGEGTLTPTGDGQVEIPAGSTVKPEGGVEVTVGDGGGKVDGEGNVTVPGGSTVTIPDGEGGRTEITVPPDSEGIVIPTGGGRVEVPAGSTVKPEGGPELTVGDGGGKVDGEGALTVPGGTTVTIPDGEGGKTQITLPGESEGTVTPAGDGKVEVPTGSTVESGDGVKLTIDDGVGTVAPDGTLTLPEGGTVTVTTPDGKSETIDVPAGGRVDPEDYQTRPAPDDDDDDDGGYVSSIGRKPSVTVSGTGGTATANSDGSVTITPDKGYEIDRVTVNGKEVAVPGNGKLTGLKGSDRVVVSFKKLPEVPTLTVDRFVDVKNADWFYDSVKAVVEQGLMNGTDETHFSPHLDTSRAMIATILWRMAGQPETGARLTYPDCVPGSWYARAVAWAGETGVVKGYDNGSFGPEDPITREQLAVMLWRYAGEPAANGTLTAFVDADAAGSWAVEGLCWAAEQGILTGRGGGVLDPAGRATRAEAAAMLVRFIGR